MEAANDMDFRPDHAIADGEVVSGDGFALEGVTTPGHTANHMAFALKGTDILLSGDHVMGWSTTIVAPPDGAMTDYMASLNKLVKRKETIYLPGHGGAVREAPRFVAGLILHRKAREASILHRLAKGATDIATIVRAIYIGLDPRLTNAAGFSVLAHMEDLVARGEDQRRLSAGAALAPFGSTFFPFFAVSGAFSGVRSETASSICSESAITRAALVPKS